MSDRVMVDQVYGAGVRVRAVLAGLLLAGSMAGCRGKEEAACGKPFAEPIDQNSSQHILPGAPEPTYKTNPPTSGAHRPGPVPSGLVLAPLDPASQVNALEAGKVVIQHGKLNAIGFAALGQLASDSVIVAPNDNLPTSIVATAWLFKLECSRVDGAALRSFIKAHVEKHESD